MEADGDAFARRALEGLAVEEFQAGRLTKPALRRLLGFGTRMALDAFLKERGISADHDQADLAQDLRDLDRIGL
ncbi:Uncharacterised protein family (UPF0175) [Methylobacterium sp. 174MFSha1.1]|uniref:UPF0175 family protein n=1 Tax=Methylobacterium sp. 174MFSha1.1 TaxID=1502749 RepID=UPI0008EE1BEB|nr:UPF0175 family protein [Methylobacterium sp. 174MFSha1.1]SFV09961.1 Uncharacterised protein family (UPF0175) [Methylobacterium sp. 174MFSha1.1]